MSAERVLGIMAATNLSVSSVGAPLSTMIDSSAKASAPKESRTTTLTTTAKSALWRKSTQLRPWIREEARAAAVFAYLASRRELHLQPVC